MWFKPKPKPDYDFMPSCAMEPTSPFQMCQGDPVTIKLTRSLEHLKQNRDQSWSSKLRR